MSDLVTRLRIADMVYHPLNFEAASEIERLTSELEIKTLQLTKCHDFIREDGAGLSKQLTAVKKERDELLKYGRTQDPLLEQLIACQKDAERGRFMLRHSSWLRNDETQTTELAVRVPYRSDLSCYGLREDAIDAAMKEQKPFDENFPFGPEVFIEDKPAPAVPIVEQEPVGGFIFNDYGGWQQVADEHIDDPGVTKLYTHPAVPEVEKYREALEMARDVLELAYEGKCRLETVPNALTKIEEVLK